MREELETKHVRENIHKWIDLIFGVDQKNPDKYNLFFPAAYPDYHTQNRIERMIEEDEDCDREIQKNLISNMSEMCIMPPKLFKEGLDQLIQKSRRKIDSQSSRIVANQKLYLNEMGGGGDMESGGDFSSLQSKSSKKKIMHATNLIDHFIEHNNPMRQSNQ